MYESSKKTSLDRLGDGGCGVADCTDLGARGRKTCSEVLHAVHDAVPGSGSCTGAGRWHRDRTVATSLGEGPAAQISGTPFTLLSLFINVRAMAISLAESTCDSCGFSPSSTCTHCVLRLAAWSSGAADGTSSSYPRG